MICPACRRSATPNSAGATAIVYRREGQSQLIELADPVTPEEVVTADMRNRDMPTLILGAFDTLFALVQLGEQ